MLFSPFFHSWERLKLTGFSLYCLLKIFYYTTYGPYFWWQVRRGREVEMEQKAQHMAHGWALSLIRVLQCRVEVEGAEHVPCQGAVIVMVNHQSLYDIPILIGYLGRAFGFIAKKELFRIPGLSSWMRRLHCIPLDRGNRLSAGKAYEALSRRIVSTRSGIILFPEGTRNRNPSGDIQPFKEASLRLAALQNIPVLPVSIDGSRFFNQSHLLYRTRNGGRLVRLKIAPLVPVEAHSSLQRKALMARIRDIIVENFAAIRLEWPAD